jgi:Thiol-activated cytolysin
MKLLDLELVGAGTLDEFFDNLPNWIQNRKGKSHSDAGEQNVGDASVSTETSGNRPYNVTRQKKSLETTPADIVTFDPAAGVFYLGNIIQEKGMRLGLGSLNPVPNLEGKRAPLRVYMDKPSIPNGSRDVADPSGSNISSAVGELIQQLGGQRVGISGYNFSYSRSDSAEQSALKMGLDASYMTSSVKSVLNTNHTADETSINGVAILNGYTIATEQKVGGYKGFFNEKFTLEDAKSLVTNNKQISQANVPCYVKSVTYGTIVVFNMKRKLTKDELKAKVEAHISIAGATIDPKFEADKMRSDATTQVTFTMIGGSGEGAIKTSTTREFNDLFGRVPTAAEMRPISYTMRSVKENALATMQRTTEYTYTEYAPNPIGEKYRLNMYVKIDRADDGIGDNTLECYGELRINNDIWWAIDRGRSEQFKREGGQTLEISGDGAPNKKNNFEFEYYYDQNNPFNFKLDITDSDDGSGDDAVGRFNQTINLADFKGKANPIEGKWSWNSGNGEACTIFLKLERIGYL